jgi:dTDP-D-glucose 4,6-dehydratase
VSTDAVFLSNVVQRMDSRKARRDLHWNPRPIRETIKDAMAWYSRREKSLPAQAVSNTVPETQCKIPDRRAI